MDMYLRRWVSMAGYYSSMPQMQTAVELDWRRI